MRAGREGNVVGGLMFADDLVLVAEDRVRPREMVSNLDRRCGNYGMGISRDGTEVMVAGREPVQCDMELDGETLGQVEQFKYLGECLLGRGVQRGCRAGCFGAAQVFCRLSPILGHGGSAGL